jgi:glycosyltransferase involved in cell wall biosynthesis
MTLHAVTPYGRNGASSRVRVFEWLDRIAEPYVLTSYISARDASPRRLARHPLAALGAEARLRRIAASRPERLLLHREASPLSRGQLEQRLLESAGHAVYDFDDALQWDTGEGRLHRRLAPKAPKALVAVQRADVVIAGNPWLADWASDHNREVVVIPSCVSPEAYRRKSAYGLSDPPRLGWIGSPNNEVYLQGIAAALREVHRRTGARLTLIGTTTTRLGGLEQMIDRVAWSEATQHEELARFDLGLFPVPDERYSYGKSGYKLVQYGAAGVPAVATPIGVNAEILAQFGMAGARTDDDWTEAILELLGCSAEERERLGRHAREVVEREYSFQAWLPRWRQVVGLDAAG